MQADRGQLTVRVVIPHYCSDQGNASSYGSTRPGNRDKRVVGLGRTLGALRALTMRSRMQDFAFHHSPETPAFEPGPAPLPPLSAPALEPRPIRLDVVVCVTGDAWLEGALRAYSRSIRVVRLEVEQPIGLGLAARDLLLQAAPEVDLSMYMEDDLVIHDPFFFEKQAWFLQRAEHQAVLMPHRYELDFDDQGTPRRLFVDGRIDDPDVALFPWSAREQAASGRFGDQPVSFDLANNPHSGCFVVSAAQARQLREQGIPAHTWVGPLETAATWSVAHRFPVYKPSWPSRQFLMLEHGHHSFSAYFERPVASANMGG